MAIHERVYDADYHGMLHVDENADGLTITADEGGTGAAVSVQLDADGVRKLRLLLTRHERNQRVTA